MPSFSTAVVFLLFWVMTSSIIITTTTTILVVAASEATTIGGTNALDLVRKIKNSKKTNANANKDNTCTIEPFLGTSQYTNCKKKETEVAITCDTTDDTATATNTKKICTYSEQPVQYDDAVAAATVVGCGDHGSFDPRTHLTRDHTTGVCRLDFIALTNSCDAAPPGASGSRFGVMVEAPLSTGPGSHNQEKHHGNDNHTDNSGLLLRFSADAGVTYYNNEDLRLTVPLNRSSPRRTLDIRRAVQAASTTNQSNCPCVSAGGAFGGISVDRWWIKETDPFQTCYQYEKQYKYCWTNSYQYIKQNGDKFHDKCVPNGGGEAWHSINADYVNTPGVDPNTNPKRCGDPCKEIYQHGVKKSQ